MAQIIMCCGVTTAVIMGHFLPVGDCPGYVTFMLDLYYGMPLALFVF